MKNAKKGKKSDGFERSAAMIQYKSGRLPRFAYDSGRRFRQRLGWAIPPKTRVGYPATSLTTMMPPFSIFG